ncbi:MAG: LPS assembly lipoprotein LptE [Rhodocyclaceae bacterium]|nr:LPS assembly lipoprotein LptE [Rhodocyclaceae bacterium]MDP2195013.1 LPS assembly lipoprotein LptE [Rhodocyclaceae bacterium]
MSKGQSVRTLFISLLVLFLAACGFQLRGSYSLPWETLYLGMPENSEMYAQIRRSVEAATQTRIITDPKAAQASLVILRNDQAKNILSLSATGLVREFQLTRSFVYRIQDANGKELAPASQIILQREMNFDDRRIFASEAEEAILWRDMQSDLVQQLLRRLSAASRTAKL